ncbi:MAG: hypothetical protein MZV63_63155 [Marinilabiliales bacterium]|nr:hypothetical protein [Marinilabiliales bacterium]
MAATIAHEIRNPLTSVKLNIQKVAEEESFAETRQGPPRACRSRASTRSSGSSRSSSTSPASRSSAWSAGRSTRSSRNRSR